jgi:SRSO17 transposase
MEPMAARLDPEHARARHASIQRLITDSEWDHRVLLGATRDHCLPLITSGYPLEAWIVDDTSFPKKGTHSVGVAHQYCGNLGKQANCQVAVTLSLVNHHAGLPAAYRLYLPEEWTNDPGRCKVAGVPSDVVFQKKWEIALALVDHLLGAQVPQSPFLGDAGYGGVPAFRQGLKDRGFRYALGIQKTEMIWPPGWAPLPPGAKPPGPGRKRSRNRPDTGFPPCQRTSPSPSWWIWPNSGGGSKRITRT